MTSYPEDDRGGLLWKYIERKISADSDHVSLNGHSHGVAGNGHKPPSSPTPNSENELHAVADLVFAALQENSEPAEGQAKARARLIQTIRAERQATNPERPGKREGNPALQPSCWQRHRQVIVFAIVMLLGLAVGYAYWRSSQPDSCQEPKPVIRPALRLPPLSFVIKSQAVNPVGSCSHRHPMQHDL